MTLPVEDVVNRRSAALRRVVAEADVCAADQRRRPVRASTPATHAARATPQGFSVVLVVGDLQASAGDDDVPPAARRALADMKDFLPYNRTSCSMRRGSSGQAHAVSRLRGPEDRDYELEITTTDPRLGRIDQHGPVGRLRPRPAIGESA